MISSYWINKGDYFDRKHLITQREKNRLVGALEKNVERFPWQKSKNGFFIIVPTMDGLEIYCLSETRIETETDTILSITITKKTGKAFLYFRNTEKLYSRVEKILDIIKLKILKSRADCIKNGSK